MREPDYDGAEAYDAMKAHFRSTERHAKRMAASGKTSVERIRVCCWCGRGITASDDVLMQLETEAVISHGLHEECAPKWEAAATDPDSERW